MIGNITYSTLDEILKKAFKMTKIPKETIRDYKLTQLINNDNTR